jgi:hypothetical protein
MAELRTATSRVGALVELRRCAACASAYALRVSVSEGGVRSARPQLE